MPPDPNRYERILTVHVFSRFDEFVVGAYGSKNVNFLPAPTLLPKPTSPPPRARQGEAWSSLVPVGILRPLAL
jgi:hypothetical protein